MSGTECALAIGRRIVALGQKAEDQGLNVQLEMNGLLLELTVARNKTVEDAHALALVSWLLLLEATRMLRQDSRSDASNIVEFAMVYGRRAVDTLEGLTGMPIEAFTGDDRFRQ